MPTIDGVAEIELENMKFEICAAITKKLAESFAQPATIRESLHTIWAEDAIALRITQRVIGKQTLYDEVSYPADWKEAFKERWFPTWARDRWPIRYTIKTFDVREVVPSLDMPDHESYIVTELT